MPLQLLIILKKLTVVLFFVNVVFGLYKVSLELKRKYKQYECTVCQITVRREAEMGQLQTHYTFCCNQPELKKKEYFLSTDCKNLKLNSKAKIYISEDEEGAYCGDNIYFYYFMRIFKHLIFAILLSSFLFSIIKKTNELIRAKDGLV